MEEHLENSSTLIVDEIHRWHDLLFDDYLNYKYRKNRSSDVDNPWGYTTYMYISRVDESVCLSSMTSIYYIMYLI